VQISRNQQLQRLEAEQAIENKGKCSNADTSSFTPTPILIGPTFETKANKNNMLERRFAIAPVMDWVDLQAKSICYMKSCAKYVHTRSSCTQCWVAFPSSLEHETCDPTAVIATS
jgi:hypothetical protein